MLSAVTNDLGHTSVEICARAHTTRTGVSSAAGTQPHLRVVSNPRFRHSSHFQAAGFENWKWKATISFFVHLRSDRIRL
jgi:hypothetical protein